MKILKLLFVVVGIGVLYTVILPPLYKTCSTGFQIATYRIFQGDFHGLFISPLIVLGGFAVIFWKTNYRKIYWSIIVIVSLLIVLMFTGFTPVRVQSIDGRRISDLRQLQASIELYVSEHNGEYPQKVEDLLTVHGITQIPKDPATNKNYDYALSSDKKSYVLRAMFNDDCFSKVDRSSLSSLEDSPKGVINGLQCNEPAYCVVYP